MLITDKVLYKIDDYYEIGNIQEDKAEYYRNIVEGTSSAGDYD